MLNAIPVLGWFLSVVFSAAMAVPFWLFWTVMGIGGHYAYFLPERYQNPGFFSLVGLFVCLSILRQVSPFAGSLSSSSSS